MSQLHTHLRVPWIPHPRAFTSTAQQETPSMVTPWDLPSTTASPWHLKPGVPLCGHNALLYLQLPSASFAAHLLVNLMGTSSVLIPHIPCPSFCDWVQNCFHHYSAAHLAPHPTAPASKNSAWTSPWPPLTCRLWTWSLHHADYHHCLEAAIPNLPKSQQASPFFAQQTTSTSNVACSQMKSPTLREKVGPLKASSTSWAWLPPWPPPPRNPQLYVNLRALQGTALPSPLSLHIVFFLRPYYYLKAEDSTWGLTCPSSSRLKLTLQTQHVPNQSHHFPQTCLFHDLSSRFFITQHPRQNPNSSLWHLPHTVSQSPVDSISYIFLKLIPSSLDLCILALTQTAGKCGRLSPKMAHSTISQCLPVLKKWNLSPESRLLWPTECSGSEALWFPRLGF